MKHPILPRGAELGLPIVSGLLLTLSFPPFHLLVPPFIALIPFLVFLASLEGGASGRGSAARGAFWMGVVHYGTLLYWLFAALVFYTWLSLLGYLIAVVVLSGFLAIVGYAVHGLRTRHGLPFWATLPVFWTAVEWTRAHLGDLAFPWLGLGHSLTGFPALVGFADVLGARGVTFWLVAINGLLAEAWLRRESLRRTWPRWALALALVVALPVGYSVMRWTTLDTRPVSRTAVVQPNIPEDLKLDRDVAVDTSRASLNVLSSRTLAGQEDVDLMVWPETALPYFLELSPEWDEWATGIARANEVTLVYGMIELDRLAAGDYQYYNAALVVTPSGERLGPYRKHYLVPVVERVPFVPMGWLRSLRRSAADGWHVPLLGDVGAFLRYFGGYGRGTEEPVFPVDGGRFGVLVCYESIFPGLTREYRRAGADFVVNITNDAWFGRERPWWSRTSALFQHPAHLVMRAIENRIGVARAANTGISLFVDPRGRVRDATPLFEPAVRVRAVETTSGWTLYTRFGDLVGPWSVVGALALWLASVYRVRVGGFGGGSEG